MKERERGGRGRGKGPRGPGERGRKGRGGEREKLRSAFLYFYNLAQLSFFISSCPNCSYIFAIRSQLCFYSLSQLFIFHFYKWVLTVFHIFTACPNCFFYIYFNKMYQLVLHFYIVSNCFFYEFQSCPNF